MSLIFSQIVYVDYYGVGGHGGCGIKADRNQRNNEIIAMVSRHINPSSYFLMNIDQINESETKKASKLDKNSKKQFFEKQPSIRAYRRDARTYSINETNEQGIINNVNRNSATVAASTRNPTQAQNSGTLSRCSICNIL